MSWDCFDLLCKCVISSVGVEKKSEGYIDAFLKGKDYMYDANVATTGGFISSEVKLGIATWLLAGGDVSYLSVIFDAHFYHCKRMLYEVLL